MIGMPRHNPSRGIFFGQRDQEAGRWSGIVENGGIAHARGLLGNFFKSRQGRARRTA